MIKLNIRRQAYLLLSNLCDLDKIKIEEITKILSAYFLIKVKKV
jgi:hypothetical protein